MCAVVPSLRSILKKWLCSATVVKAILWFRQVQIGVFFVTLWEQRNVFQTVLKDMTFRVIRATLGIAVLASLFCLLMATGLVSFNKTIRLIIGAHLVWLYLFLALFTWRVKSRSIVKFFIAGFLCVFVSVMVFPASLYIHGAAVGRLTDPELVYLNVAWFVGWSSLYGGVIGIAYYSFFSKRKQKGAEAPTTSEDSPSE